MTTASAAAPSGSFVTWAIGPYLPAVTAKRTLTTPNVASKDFIVSTP
jgi:membrane protein YqaA with SNARE-associated domain